MPRPGPRTTYKYSDQFKATAVRLSQLRGVSVQQVAESLYIHPFMLSRWRKEARALDPREASPRSQLALAIRAQLCILNAYGNRMGSWQGCRE